MEKMKVAYLVLMVSQLLFVLAEEVDEDEPKLPISPPFIQTGYGILTQVLLVSFICYFLMKLVIFFGNDYTSKFNVVLILLSCFVCSIPWEWYRMYKAKLAEKIANVAPTSCNPEDMTALDSILFWLNGKLSTAEKDCVVYYREILVDPFWEVSPLAAFLSCGTKFLVVPITYFSSACGKCFRVFMNEIPLHWQFPVFMAILFIIIITIMIVFGLEISTPSFKIGFHQVQYYKQKLRESEEKYERKCIEHARLKTEMLTQDMYNMYD